MRERKRGSEKRERKIEGKRGSEKGGRERERANLKWEGF